MRYFYLFFLILMTVSFAGEYDFDMDEIETKSYEYSGYLRADDRYQQLNTEAPLYIQSGDDRSTQNYVHLEALLNLAYFKDIYTFKSSFTATYDHVNSISKDDLVINELYAEAKPSNNHMFLAGKQSLQWGKGYYFNPVAFFDRPKDPTQPTNVREGFWMANYGYTKTFNAALKNIRLDLLYLRASSSFNEDYYKFATNEQTSHNIGAKLYLLLFDTDIDLIYDYSDAAKDKIGIDFSKNILSNFEIHGEAAKELGSYHSYLLGLRYLSSFDLTLISEYLYRSNGLSKEEIEEKETTLPFAAKSYVFTLLSQKEPLDILYFSLYFKDMFNLEDQSHQDKFGFTYRFRNNVDLDLSYNINSGSSLSEFGKKTVSDFAWLKVMWYF